MILYLVKIDLKCCFEMFGLCSLPGKYFIIIFCFLGLSQRYYFLAFPYRKIKFYHKKCKFSHFPIKNNVINQLKRDEFVPLLILGKKYYNFKANEFFYTKNLQKATTPSKNNCHKTSNESVKNFNKDFKTVAP